MDRLIHKKQDKLSEPDFENWLLTLSTEELIDIICNPEASVNKTKVKMKIKLKFVMYINDSKYLKKTLKSSIRFKDKNWNLEGYTLMYIKEAREYYNSCVSLLEHKNLISPKISTWIEDLKSVIEQISYYTRKYIDFCDVESKEYILTKKISKKEIKAHEWLTFEEFKKRYPDKMDRMATELEEALERDLEDAVQELHEESAIIDEWDKN